tara:strand:+ start:612 stop:869 length:258 start_codon:yes stop_codon:yes gene_type:complete
LILDRISSSPTAIHSSHDVSLGTHEYKVSFSYPDCIRSTTYNSIGDILGKTLGWNADSVKVDTGYGGIPMLCTMKIGKRGMSSEQ